MLTEKDIISMPHPPMPEGKEHLVYRDLPKMALPFWEWMKDFLADYELEILTDASYIIKGQKVGRGQIFVHPDGLTAIRDAVHAGAANHLF